MAQILNLIITNPTKILLEEEKFYKNLYTDNLNDQCKQNCSLLDITKPTLNESDKNMCEQEITLEECGESLKELPNNKTPGSDGFTSDFYKFFWKDIKQFVYNSFKYSFESGELSIDQRRAILTLLPKPNKDIRFLKNWRPISLLNTDNKILTKLLATRLQKVIQQIVKDDQVGYIKNRFIGENIRTLADLIQYTNERIDPGIILLLDFEKAFDTISWKFLVKTLKAFNFGENFIKWIQIIYNKPLCSVINNGYTTNSFEISRGIRQGCPISALLFILVVEILALNFRNRNEIEGIKIIDNEIIIAQMADDTSLFLKNATSIENAFQLLDHFHKCAGLKLNKSKTKVIPLGLSNSIDLKRLGLEIVNDPIKVLGIWVCKDTQQMIDKNVSERLLKLRNLLNMWKSRDLTIKGKITILRSHALPLIIYLASMLFIPDDIIQEIDNMFFSFIWPKGKHHVKKKVLIQEIEQGGLKMPDIKAMVKAIKFSWIRRLSTKDNNFTCLAKACLKISDIKSFLLHKNDTVYLNKDVPPFYKQLLQIWYELYSIEPTSNEEVRREHLWHNKYILIGDKPAHFKKWQENGICIINDIILDRNKFKTLNKLNQDFHTRINVMEYNSLISAIPRTWKQMITNNKIVITNEIELKVKIKKVEKCINTITCKEIYWELISKLTDRPTAFAKWEELYYYVNFEWEHILRLPYNVARETSLQSLQYQIINRYFPCAENVHKWYPNEPPTCTYCNADDSIEHYFSDCEKVKPFWIWFRTLMNDIYHCNIMFSSLDIIFGIPNLNSIAMFDVMNMCILIAKDFIRKCKSNDGDINIRKYQLLLKHRLSIEKLILTEQNQENIFQEKYEQLYRVL